MFEAREVVTDVEVPAHELGPSTTLDDGQAVGLEQELDFVTGPGDDEVDMGELATIEDVRSRVAAAVPAVVEIAEVDNQPDTSSEGPEGHAVSAGLPPVAEHAMEQEGQPHTIQSKAS